MHGFVRHLPEYRRAKQTGEQEERDRVLKLIRQRRTRTQGTGQNLDRGPEAPDAEPDFERAMKAGEAKAVDDALEELERAVRNGWHR